MLFLEQRLAVILLSIVAPALCRYWQEPKNRPDSNEEPLPASVIPRSYDLKLKPNLDENYLNGSVYITIICHETTDKIILHAHPDIQIKTGSVRLISDESPSVIPLSTTRNEENSIITFHLESPIKIGGLYHLHIEFKGLIYDIGYRFWMAEEGGFYKLSNNEGRFYLTAKLMPNNARRMFPCFDDLQFKATFKISVAHPRNMSSLSVMPIKFSEFNEDESLVWDHFYPSPPISAMSVSLLVSELIEIETTNITTKQGSYPLTIYHQESLQSSNEVNDQLHTIRYILEIIEDMFDVPFPLPKLDIFLLPMSYRGVIQQSSMGSITALHDIYDLPTLIPKLLDQWLVHAVTPCTWNTFNVTKILSSFYLQQLGLNQNVKNTSHIWRDIYQSTHLSVLKSNPYLFGVYPYQRRGYPFGRTDEWFLEMIQAALSKSTFKNAVRNFLTDNMFNTFTEDDFWKSFTRQGWQENTLIEDVSIEDIAKSWLQKQFPGFPLLTVTRNYEENSAQLEQHLYLANGTLFNNSNLTEEEDALLWWIPISYVSPCNLKPSLIRPTIWMKEEQQNNISNLPDPDSFIIMNPTDSGMFMVTYDDNNWNLITDTMASAENKIPIETCRKVLQDTFLLATGGRLSYGTALNASLFLYHSNDTISWITVLSHLFEPPVFFFEGTSIENGMNNYLRSLIGQFYETYYEEQSAVRDNQNSRYVWDMARRTLARVGYQPFINKTHLKMTMYPLEDPGSGLTIFCPEFLNDSSLDWNQGLSELQFDMSFMDYDQQRFWQRSMAKCPGYDNLVERVLNMAFGDNSQNNNLYLLMTLITNTEASLTRTLNFYVDNFGQVPQRKKNALGSCIYTVARKIKSEEQLNKLIEFQRKYENKTSPYNFPSLDGSIEQAKNMIQWCKHILPDIAIWLTEALPASQMGI